MGAFQVFICGQEEEAGMTRRDAWRLAGVVEGLYFHGLSFWEAVIDAVGAHDGGGST